MASPRPMPPRNVSFSPTQEYRGLNDDIRPTPKTHASAAPKKTALKTGQHAGLPPPSTFQHPDPLLRRMRLVDGKGRTVDLKHTFRDAKLVLFYFGSQWNAEQTKGYQRTISDLCREYPHELKVIYVSVDTEEKYYDAATRNRPWLSMKWADGSSDDAEADTSETGEPRETFLLAGDEDLDAHAVANDTAGDSYVRPLSRVFMADKLQVLMTPTLAVYSPATRTFLDKNVRISRLKHGNAAKTIAAWMHGEPSPTIRVQDILYMVPWTVAMLALALAYLVLVAVGGEQFSVPNLLRQYT